MFNEKRFTQWVEYDLKFILQSLRYTDNVVGFSKFIVFYRITHDPEIPEIMADQIKKSIRKFTTDEILTSLVNFSHTLSPESQTLFELACEEFTHRLDGNFNATSRDLYI